MSTHTISKLKRWSCIDKQPPATEGIKALHVYDFDNTLFKTPMPNQQLWNGATVGHLQKPDAFVDGGWWHDARILEATGQGIKTEEPRAWEGWWNEEIVSLVRLSMEQKDALNVLLTGRSESGFADLIKRMVASKKLDFDMICLKPKMEQGNQGNKSTLSFKQALLEDIIFTYKDAEEIRLYEDRLKHVASFRLFFKNLTKDFSATDAGAIRKPIVADVVEVPHQATTLDPVIEVSEVQRLINDHNAAIARGEVSPYGHLSIQQAINFTAYLVDPSAVDSLKSLAQLPPDIQKEDVRYLANNIVITPRPASAGIMRRVGGLGKKVTWSVAATASYEGRVWAAKVRPVPDTLSYHTESRVPLLVLAVRKGGRPVDANNIRQWQPLPPERAVSFDTVVGEKVLLEIMDDRRQPPDATFGFPATRPARRKRFPAESAPTGPLSLMLPQAQPLSLQLTSAGAPATAQQASLPAPVASKRTNLGASHPPSHHHHSPSSVAAAQPLQHQLPPKPAEAPPLRSDQSAVAAHRAYHGQQYYGRGKSGPGGYRGGRGGGAHRGSRGDRGGGGPYSKGRHRGGGGGGGGGGGSGAASLASSAFDGASDALLPSSHHPPTAPRYNYGGNGGGNHANGSAAGEEGGVRIRYVANGGNPTG